MLNEQGEQLDRIEGGLDNINAEMKEAEKHLTGMEKWCGLCLCPWNRRKKVKDVDEAVWEKNGPDGVVRRQPGDQGDVSAARGGGGGGPYIQRCGREGKAESTIRFFFVFP